MFRSIQMKFAHHALNTIRVFTQSDEVKNLDRLMGYKRRDPSAIASG